METCFRTCIPKKYLMNNEQVLQVLKFFPVKNDKQIGRPSANLEAIIQGIFYILKTGCQWNAIPRCFGPSSTIHDHFQKIGYFCKISRNRRRGHSVNVLKHFFRWSIERTHSWINRFRRLLIRWEKKLDNFLAMIHFACQTIVFNKT